MDFKELFIAFSLGIAFSAPPGIVTAEAIRRGLGGDFWSAVAVGLGSLIGDAVYAILALAGIGIIIQNSDLKFLIGIIGSCLLFYLARDALLAKLPNEDGPRNKNNQRAAFLSGAGLSLTNPWAIAFWIGFGGTLLASGIESPNEKLGIFLFSFILGAATWVFILSALILFGKRFINQQVFRIISLISALVFIGTGLYSLYSLLV